MHQKQINEILSFKLPRKAPATCKCPFLFLSFLLINTSMIHSMSLQAETAIDFSTWLQALRSWNPQQVKTSSGNTRKISQHTSSSAAAASANKKVASNLLYLYVAMVTTDIVWYRHTLVTRLQEQQVAATGHFSPRNQAFLLDRHCKWSSLPVKKETALTFYHL